MTTLTERLLALDKNKEVNTLQRTSVVYPVRSGTKNIPHKFEIGGNFASIGKKVPRNPIPLFNGEEFLKNVNKKVQTITSGIVKVQVRPKLPNKEVKDEIELVPSRYIGLEGQGAVGTPWAAGRVKKQEEMKLISVPFLSGD